MNQQDQQVIDELFQHLHNSAAQAGPRDPEAEARIQQHFQQGPPGLLYHMAQTLVGQQHALRQAQAQLAAYQQQGGAPAGFAQPGPQGAGQPGYPGYGPPPGYQRQPGIYQQAYQPPPQQPGQGFLSGAGKIALGVGGGILGAEALSSIFGGGGLFGGDRDDDGDRDDRDDDRDYGGQDDGGQDWSGQDWGGQDGGGQDWGGQDFGDGGFGDDSGGGW